VDTGLLSIEHVVGKRLAGHPCNAKAQYLIKWRGYPSSANTWEPAESVVDDATRDIAIVEYLLACV
jgi:hypothetical protein